jgi:hypothetical protein
MSTIFGMHNRVNPYLLFALPAVPYLFGVGLQVSGITDVLLSIVVFEVAALLAAAVAWSFQAARRESAGVPVRDQQAAPRMQRWFGVFRAEVRAGIVVFLLCNAAIAGFVSVAQHRQEATRIQSAQAKQLGQYYVELGSFLNTQLPRSGSDADVAKWQDALVVEARRIREWMRQNMSSGAEYRFTDLHGIKNLKWPNAVNERHRELLDVVFAFQGNLLEMMKTTAWDKKLSE